MQPLKAASLDKFICSTLFSVLQSTALCCCFERIKCKKFVMYKIAEGRAFDHLNCAVLSLKKLKFSLYDLTFFAFSVQFVM